MNSIRIFDTSKQEVVEVGLPIEWPHLPAPGDIIQTRSGSDLKVVWRYFKPLFVELICCPAEYVEEEKDRS